MEFSIDCTSRKVERGILRPMRLSELSDRILDELRYILHRVDEDSAKGMLAEILMSDRIFLAGMGRSGLIVRSFAMRLMQVGLQVYVVGEVTTPAMRKGDLLIAISGSGETKTTHHIVSVAKSSGARVFLLTAQTTSSIGDISELVLVLPSAPESTLPLKSAFECAAHFLLEAMVIQLMGEMGATQREMMKRHSNLE